MPPLFHCLGACLVLLLPSFLVKQACLVLWLSKPALLSNHYLTGASYIFFYVQSLSGINYLITHFVPLGFTDGSAGKEPACNMGDLGSVPRLGRSPEERKGYPLQYSGLENSMDRRVHGVTNSRTLLSDFHFLSLYPVPIRRIAGLDRKLIHLLQDYNHSIWGVFCLFFSLFRDYLHI